MSKTKSKTKSSRKKPPGLETKPAAASSEAEAAAELDRLAAAIAHHDALYYRDVMGDLGREPGKLGSRRDLIQRRRPASPQARLFLPDPALFLRLLMRDHAVMSRSAASRASSVMVWPASMRAISSRRDARLRARRRGWPWPRRPGPRTASLAISKWPLATAATWGAWVTANTCTREASRARRSPTAAAVAPPTPASTSSNTKVGAEPRAASTTFSARMYCASSPPEATFISGPGSVPGLVLTQKATRSMPPGPPAPNSSVSILGDEARFVELQRRELAGDFGRRRPRRQPFLDTASFVQPPLTLVERKPELGRSQRSRRLENK